MFKESDKCSVFMLLWMIVALVATGKVFPIVAMTFSFIYAIQSLYYSVKEYKDVN